MKILHLLWKQYYAQGRINTKGRSGSDRWLKDNVDGFKMRFIGNNTGVGSQPTLAPLSPSSYIYLSNVSRR